MNCPHCRQEIQQDANICPHCGASLSYKQDSCIQQSQQNVPIPNNLVWAILTTLFCCLPTGIYAIICAAKVDNLVMQGRIEEAKKASNDAKKWSIYGAVIFVGLTILWLIVGLVVGMLGRH